MAADAVLAVLSDDFFHAAEQAAVLVWGVLGEPGAVIGFGAGVEAFPRAVGADETQQHARHLAVHKAQVW